MIFVKKIKCLDNIYIKKLVFKMCLVRSENLNGLFGGCRMGKAHLNLRQI